MDLSENFATVRARAPATPVLRSVLLCDIVDSTAMVERLGDQRAAALMQRHDQLLRRLIAFCHGQLIDRADGMLALFERPIQALDFALRYQRGLLELGREEGLELKARAGLHVGDVVMWANAPGDVLAGHKAFEVEGLAKPVAARLMNLALPGQILMSGMAQNLCQRAIGELGETAPKLRWLLHGRYRFKGVPAPMLVHEVGEPGMSPLRAPESGAKAWRELPLWRRPPVLALEVLALGVLVVGGIATTLRAPPAIAFAERDWVVVADLQNRTEEPMFDEALDTALLVGLEQSRHVNTLSQLQIERALTRMQRGGQPLDRQLATELALREGARAVVLPTIAQVGGITRVSLEVIDPQSGVTVHTESADAPSPDDVLAALDKTTDALRATLGESLSSVEASSAPLELVTTPSLEALHAYSMAQRARYDNRVQDAEPLYLEALRLDPGFAMAALRMAFLRYISADTEGTREWLAKANAHRDRLTQRELIFLDGAAATLAEPETALEKFRMLATLYPDEFRAYYNYAYFAHFDLLRSEDGLAMLAPALVTRNPAHADAAHLAGTLALAANRYEEALTQFGKSETLGNLSWKRERVLVWLAKGDRAQAERVAASPGAAGTRTQQIEQRQYEVELPLDAGRWREAIAAAEALERDAEAIDAPDLVQRSFRLTTLSLRAYAPDTRFAADLQAWAEPLATRLPGADDLSRRHLLFQALAGGWLAAYTGDEALAKRLRALVADDPLVAVYPANAAMARILDAELALRAHDPRRAQSVLAVDLEPQSGLFFSRVVAMRARAAAGDVAGALELARWLDANRGRAVAEATSFSVWQPANLVESGLARHRAAGYARTAGAMAEADRHAAAFAAAWPGGDADALVRAADAVDAAVATDGAP